MCGESILRVCMNWKLQSFRDIFRIKKRKLLTKVAQTVEQALELLRPADVSVDTILSSEVPVTAGEDITGTAAELDKAKLRIAESESAETMTVRRHEALLDEVKQRHAEKVSV